MSEEKTKVNKYNNVTMLEKILPYVKEELQCCYPCNSDTSPEGYSNIDDAWINKKQSWEVTHAIVNYLVTFYKPISEYVIKMKVLTYPNMVPEMENIIHATIDNRILKRDAYLMLRQYLKKNKYR
jgi:aryl-phospho-beta-D-glucosidase BglC (GH1 family)